MFSILKDIAPNIASTPRSRRNPWTAISVGEEEEEDEEVPAGNSNQVFFFSPYPSFHLLFLLLWQLRHEQVSSFLLLFPLFSFPFLDVRSVFDEHQNSDVSDTCQACVLVRCVLDIRHENLGYVPVLHSGYVPVLHSLALRGGRFYSHPIEFSLSFNGILLCLIVLMKYFVIITNLR